jgi:endoglucanase
MRDCLALWKEAGWGWTWWNLRGNFGVLDSGRRNAAYDDFRGRTLDRQMLALLRTGLAGSSRMVWLLSGQPVPNSSKK